MNSRLVVCLLVFSLMVLQMSSVEGNCFQYVCKRRCLYRPPFFDEYSFRYIWPMACGHAAVYMWGFKACCRTYGRY